VPNSDSKPPGVASPERSIAAISTTAADLVISIDWQVPDRSCYPTDDQIKRWARTGLLQRDSDQTRQLCIRIVDRDEARHSNAQWRDRDYATNILSFPADWPQAPGLTALLDEIPLGDLLICADVVNTEAADSAISQDAHWAHIVVHGMLHLQGFDHETEAEATEMEGIEVAMLAALGFANPYEQGSYALDAVAGNGASH